MRINHFSKVRWIDFFKSNIVLSFHYIIFLASFLIGAFSVIFDFSLLSSNFLLEFINGEALSDYWSVFKQCFYICFAIITAVYMFSFYPFGAPLTTVVFTAFSYVVGFVSTSVCSLYGIKGFVFNTLSFVLPTVIFTVACAMLSSASVSFSTNVASVIFKNKAVVEIRQKTKDIFLLYLILSVVVILNSFLASFLIMIISKIITI